MSEQPRLLACDARQPVSGSPLVPAQGFELPACPSCQGKVDALQGRIEGRRTEPPVVVDPAANARVEHPREIIKGLVTSSMHRPTPNGPTDRRERLCADCGTERDAHSPGPFAHHPWPESVAKKVELTVIEGSAATMPTRWRTRRPDLHAVQYRRSPNACLAMPEVTKHDIHQFEIDAPDSSLTYWRWQPMRSCHVRTTLRCAAGRRGSTLQGLGPRQPCR